jgi:arylsulfatase A-like enzyme
MKKLIVVLITITSLISFSQTKPNVIVVLADDIGIGDISHYRRMHSDNIIVETPTIDKLSKEGMIFTDAHSPAALCAPSRYAIMTGNSCFRSEFPWGVWGAYQESPIKPDQLTLGKLMKNAGYQTAFFGKWHLGGDYYKKGSATEIYRGERNKPEVNVDISKIVGGGPTQNGFDFSVTLPAGIQASPYAVYENDVMLPLHKDSKIGYISQENMTKIGVKLDKLEGLGDDHWDPRLMGPLLANKAVNYIEKQASTKEPFFIYYSSQAVHLPHNPAKMLNGKEIAGTTPSSHLDLIKELDTQMGMLVETLKEKGIYENTLFIFTSDNGGLLVKQSLATGHRPSDLLNGGKNSAFEGGHRVPFIATWPAKIKPNRSSNIQVLGLDVLATLAALTEQEIAPNQAMDSANLLPILLDESNKAVRERLVNQSGTQQEGIIIENGWKLIIEIDKKDKTYKTRKPTELFNLNANPHEDTSKNLINSAKHKSKLDELFKKYNDTRDAEVKSSI